MLIYSKISIFLILKCIAIYVVYQYDIFFQVGKMKLIKCLLVAETREIEQWAECLLCAQPSRFDLWTTIRSPTTCQAWSLSTDPGISWGQSCFAKNKTKKNLYWSIVYSSKNNEISTNGKVYLKILVKTKTRIYYFMWHSFLDC